MVHGRGSTDNEPFIEGVPHEKPPQASYYPDDMTKDEFNSWVQTLSDADKQKATGFFWLIRRGADQEADDRALQPGLQRISRAGRASAA